MTERMTLGGHQFRACWPQPPMAPAGPQTDHRNHPLPPLPRADGVGGGAGHDLASSPTTWKAT